MPATAGNRLCVSSSRSVAVWAACPVGRPYTDQHTPAHPGPGACWCPTKAQQHRRTWASMNQKKKNAAGRSFEVVSRWALEIGAGAGTWALQRLSQPLALPPREIAYLHAERPDEGAANPKAQHLTDRGQLQAHQALSLVPPGYKNLGFALLHVLLSPFSSSWAPDLWVADIRRH
jgi:hypothetical protein